MPTLITTVSSQLYEIAAQLRSLIGDDTVLRFWQVAEIQQAVHDITDIARALAARSL